MLVHSDFNLENKDAALADSYFRGIRHLSECILNLTPQELR